MSGLSSWARQGALVHEYRLAPGFPNERILIARFLRVDVIDQPGIEAVHIVVMLLTLM